MTKHKWILVLGMLLSAFPAVCPAQEAEEPAKAYTGNIGAGLSLTGGNTDTASFNVSGELTYDPKTKNQETAGASNRNRTGDFPCSNGKIPYPESLSPVRKQQIPNRETFRHRLEYPPKKT